MIAICIVTYNQEQYIAQAIESVQMQQCNEPFRIYIGDDASIDNTQAICETYAAHDKRIIYIRRKKNIGLTNNTIELYRQIISDGCEYIAMLDGDDYWIDKHKLKLQIDYIRIHPEVGFVHTNGSTSLNSNRWTFGQREGVYGLDSVGFANCTVLFRTNLLSKKLLDDIEEQHFLWLDYPLYGVFYQYTKWAYLPQKTAIWREHTSVSNPPKAEDIIRLGMERCRMWKWLDDMFPGEVGYSPKEAMDYIYERRLNLIYTFDNKEFVTEGLLTDYHPYCWKQRLKLLGLKHKHFYYILQKCIKIFAHSKKKL